MQIALEREDGFELDFIGGFACARVAYFALAK
jgi:hypothetical protein